MNETGAQPTRVGLANFSEAKILILEDVRARWDKFRDSDLASLSSNDDLVEQVSAKYSIDMAQAKLDVDALMQGRQI